jgi:septal ring-binding cell division protein DamX
MNTSATPTHPVEPETYPNETSDEAADNPTQLPVQPEFGQALPPPEPEEPGVKKPTI